MSTNQSNNSQVRMTEYSHGSGCGCKIAPKLLEDILKTETNLPAYPGLLVGNDTKDDAAVYDLNNGTSVVSTTDFFMPIVDDPFEFGQISATNAISDIYAMGGTPLMAISIFGWPIDKLGPEVASKVIEGGRFACQQANIPLAGGHSIDSPEPIFGLAVTGLVDTHQVKRNDQAVPGCQLFLTKPLGIGILTTALKRKVLKEEHLRIAPDTMCRLNSIGAAFGKLPGVKAMTDVTGFGLMGHLREVCEASNVRAVIKYESVPKLAEVENYLEMGCSPGGAKRNFESYGHRLGPMSSMQQQILCDPQTSGGLLVAVEPSAVEEFQALARQHELSLHSIGELFERSDDDEILIEVI